MKRFCSVAKKRAALLTLFLGLGAALTACSNIDQPNVFRELSFENVDKGDSYNKLKPVSNSIRNLVFGTDKYNDGNYVLIVTTETDGSQINFLNGSTNMGTSSINWAGELGTTIRQVQNRYSTYPNGVKFLIWNDIVSDPTKWNPYARYPVVANDDELATKTDKDRSDKLRRNDASAIRYREITAFIQKVYGENIANFINQSNVHAQRVGSDVTKAIVIAFRNNNLGQISANFYGLSDKGSGAPGSNQNPPSNGDGKTDTKPDDSNKGTNPAPSTKSAVIDRSYSYSFSPYAIKVSTDFLNFLDGVYKPLN